MVDTAFTKQVKASKEDKTLEPISADKSNSLAQQADSIGMTGMGWFDKYKLGGDISKITRTQLAEVAKTIVEKQKQEITHHLMLDLDIKKKQALTQYMENVGALNANLLERSTEMEGELLDILVSSVEDIHKRKQEWIARIDALKLSDEDHKKEIDSMNAWIDLARNQVEGKVGLLIQTHSESISKTMQLLKDTALESQENQASG